MNFPKKLKELRIANHLTQEELANKIFVSRTLITKYESGDAIPTKENIEKLSIALNTKISNLIDSEDSALLTLEYAKYSIISNYLFSAIAIVINTLWVVISIIPIFGVWKYVYPIPEGSAQPGKQYFMFSLMQNSLQHGSYVVLISLIFSILLVILIVFSFFIKNKKIHFVLKWIIRILFIVSLFLILFGLVLGLGSANL